MVAAAILLVLKPGYEVAVAPLPMLKVPEVKVKVPVLVISLPLSFKMLLGVISPIIRFVMLIAAPKDTPAVLFDFKVP